MKVLEVGGDGDGLALSFESLYNPESYADLWDRAWASVNHNLTMVHIETIDGDEYEEFIEIWAHEFKDVDPEFVDFIQTEFVYDPKSHNFYIVEEKSHVDTSRPTAN